MMPPHSGVLTAAMRFFHDSFISYAIKSNLGLSEILPGALPNSQDGLTQAASATTRLRPPRLAA